MVLVLVGLLVVLFRRPDEVFFNPRRASFWLNRSTVDYPGPVPGICVCPHIYPFFRVCLAWPVALLLIVVSYDTISVLTNVNKSMGNYFPTVFVILLKQTRLKKCFPQRLESGSTDGSVNEVLNGPKDGPATKNLLTLR